MQDSAGKSIRLIKAAGKYLRAAAEANALYAVLLSLIILSSCTSLKDSYKAAPYSSLPGGCLFYFALDPVILPLDEVEDSIRPLLERTEEITGGAIRGEYYLLLRGSYPDTFAEKRISETAGWLKGDCNHCYHNEDRNISLFFARNNHIFVSNYMNPESGDKPIQKIYDNYKRRNKDDIADSFPSEYFTNRDRSNLFQFYSEKGSDIVPVLNERRLESPGIGAVEIVLKESVSDKREFMFESILSFSSEKEAGRYSPALKLVLLDLIRKEDSGYKAANGRRFSVVKDENILRVSDIIVSDRVTGRFFNKIIHTPLSK